MLSCALLKNDLCLKSMKNNPSDHFDKLLKQL